MNFLRSLLPLLRVALFGLPPAEKRRRISVTKFDDKGQPTEFRYLDNE